MLSAKLVLDHPAGELTLVVNYLRVGDGVVTLWTLLKQARRLGHGRCCAGIPDYEPLSLLSAVRDTLSEYENDIALTEDLADEAGLSTMTAVHCNGLIHEACLDDCIEWLDGLADNLA